MAPITNKMPGIAPPKNILPTETPAKEAHITIGILGGIIGPATADPAVMAALNSFGYPCFFIEGVRTLPSPALSATASPDIPAKIILEDIFNCHNPPRILPKSAL